MKFFVGIDPGEDTGYAIWLRGAQGGSFTEVTSLDFWTTVMRLAELKNVVCPQHGAKLVVCIEASNLNPSMHAGTLEGLRKRTDLNQSQRESIAMNIAQKVGGVKREATLLQRWCEIHNVECRAVKPTGASNTKMPSDRFNKLTGWNKRTNEHGRDAAMLVWGL